MTERDDFTQQRAAMVDTQLRAREIRDSRVLSAMGEVPRELFVPAQARDQAYFDRPLPIGHGATISQPYIVAVTLELAAIEPGDRVLDVGTGSGYQAAIAVQMGATVFGVEYIEALVQTARQSLDAGGYPVDLVCGDGYAGLPEHAPYEAIVVAAAAPEVPQALVDQLADGGRLVIPIGPPWQGAVLSVVTKTEGGPVVEPAMDVRFVPLVPREGGSASGPAQ